MFQIKVAYLNLILILSYIVTSFRTMSTFDKINNILYQVYVKSG
jgi:hypothetical protein